MDQVKDMKAEADNFLPSGEVPKIRPLPFVHPSGEPEYDTEQLKRRASEVTSVLESILEDGSLPPAPGSQAPPPPPA